MAYQPKSYRKFLATSLTAAMVATAVAPAVMADSHKDAAASFSDVSEGTTHYEEITYLLNQGVIGGFPDGEFKANANLDRGSAALMIGRALHYLDSEDKVKAEYKTEDASDYSFNDVAASSKYYELAALLKKEGIFKGDADVNLNVQDDVTRSEMALILTRAFDLEANGEEAPFTDMGASAKAADAIDALYANAITEGFPNNTFRPADDIKRGDFSAFVSKAMQVEEVVVEAAVESVSAINANTAKVTFNTPISEVDFNNFTISDGLTVTEATLLSDGKTVEVEVNENFTRNQEYTLTATGFKDANGEAFADSSAEFSWAVEEGITVELANGSLVDGETTGITVQDQDGKDVTGAKVEVSSTNTNVVSVNQTASQNVEDAVFTAAAAGSADVTVKVTLSDGVILTNTFKVTVSEVPNELASQGYTLVDGIGTAPENTVAFDLATKKTSMFAGEDLEVAMFDTLNNNPLESHVDFSDATVRSLNPIIATASVSGTDLEVVAKAGQSGKASFEVTFDDDTKRTFSVDVKEVSELTDISVDATSIKLSDEEVNDGVVEGVNAKTVNVSLIDQYENGIATPTPFGKVTVTSNTDGIEILDSIGGSVFTDNELTIADASSVGTDSFTVVAKEDKVVNGKIEVKYFENASDAQPTSTKTINVSTVDVDTASTPVDLDIVAKTEIDVNAPNTASIADVDAINFATADVYTLDSNGNRLEEVTASALLDGTDDYVGITTSELLFLGNDELTLLTSASTVDVDVTADGITKTLPIKYINSANVPASATVNTNPVTVKLASTDNELTFEELIFGAIDPSQLVEDTDIDEFIAVSNSAKNAGYLYNKSLVTVKDAAGEVIPTGADVYNLNSDNHTTPTTTGNIWYDEEFIGLNTNYSDVTFNADFSVANVEKTNTGDIGLSNGQLNLDASVKAASKGDAVSFTLVVNSIYSASTDASVTDNNLLEAPVTINVTVTK